MCDRDYYVGKENTVTHASRELRAKTSSGQLNCSPPRVLCTRDQMLMNPTVHSGQSKPALLAAEKLGRSHWFCATISRTR